MLPTRASSTSKRSMSVIKSASVSSVGAGPKRRSMLRSCGLRPVPGRVPSIASTRATSLVTNRPAGLRPSNELLKSLGVLNDGRQVAVYVGESIGTRQIGDDPGLSAPRHQIRVGRQGDDSPAREARGFHLLANGGEVN